LLSASRAFASFFQERVEGLVLANHDPNILPVLVSNNDYHRLDQFGATGLFQLVSDRYEHGSMILTSNKSYADWGSIFQDNVIASATLDRLLHHSTTINIKGESYRLKDKRKAGVLSKAAVTPVS
jgi:hypothetical protein